MKKTYHKKILVFGGSSEIVQNVVNHYKGNILLVLISRNIKKTKEIFKSAPKNIEIIHYSSNDLAKPKELELIKKIHIKYKYFDRYFIGYSLNRDKFIKEGADNMNLVKELLLNTINSYLTILDLITKINMNSLKSQFIVFIPGWCWHDKSSLCEKCVGKNFLTRKLAQIKVPKNINIKLVHLPPIRTRRNAFCNIYRYAYKPEFYGKKIFKLIESKKIIKRNINAFNFLHYLKIKYGL